MIKRAILAGALGVALATAGAVTAHAVKANEVIRYHDVVDGVNEELSMACDYEVTFSVDARGTFRIFDDGRVTDNSHGTYSISANGRTLTQTWAGLFKGQAIETFDFEAGTLTVDFDDTVHGLDQKWVDDDGNIIIMDRGRANHLGTAVIDLQTGQFIHLVDVHDTNGPHPIIDQGGLDPSLACDYFNA